LQLREVLAVIAHSPPRLRAMTASLALGVLPITGAVALEVGYLPPPLHSDSFDRLLVAQAKLLGISLLSSSKHFDSYEVTRVW